MNLTFVRFEDARVHCVVLNIRSALPLTTPVAPGNPRDAADQLDRQPIPQDPTACTAPDGSPTQRSRPEGRTD